MSRDSAQDAQELITRHLHLVDALAGKLRRRTAQRVDLDELRAFGREGLVQAAHRYDPKRGVTFTTFAYYRIRGAMFDGLRKMESTAAPTHMIAFAQAADAYIEPEAELPAPRSGVEAAEKLATMVSDLATAYVVSASAYSVYDEEPDQSTPDPEAASEAREAFEQLRQSIDTLPEREQALLQMLYFQGLTVREAADELGVSKGWISRLHRRALTALRRKEDLRKKRPPPGGIRI